MSDFEPTIRVVAGREGERLVFTLCGEFDLASVRVVQAHLQAAVSDRRHEIVIDLTKVTFMDSSGLRLLLDTHERLTAQNRPLIVRGAAEQPRRLFELSGADDLLLIES